MSAIIACIWQGLAVAWVTALLLRTTSRLNAATRHAIWWLALGSVLALPLAHFAAMTVELPGPALATTIDADTPALLLPAPPDWLIACLTGAWLGIVLLSLARLVYAVRLVADVKRRSLRVDEAVQRRLKLWTAVRGTGRAPELRVSSELSGACVARIEPQARHSRLDAPHRRARSRRARSDRDARARSSRPLRRLAAHAPVHGHGILRPASGGALHQHPHRPRAGGGL